MAAPGELGGLGSLGDIAIAENCLARHAGYRRFTHRPFQQPHQLLEMMDVSGGPPSIGAAGALSVAEALSLPAESYGNDPNVEMIWAMKAYQHAEVYFNLISSVDPRILKLTRLDEGIYTAFRAEFPDLRIDVIDPEDLKSPAAKEKWRPFCMQFENQVEDFNYGTLLRLDSNKDYTEENTIFSTRIQFFAIEIARNREGCNDAIYNHRQKEAAK